MITSLKINGVDITNDVDVCYAVVTDYAGDKFDTLEVHISDVENNFRIWEINLDDTIEVVKDGFSSGVMYIDTLNMINSKFVIKANSLRRSSKVVIYRALENISFDAFAKTISNSLNLDLKTYNLSSATYDRLEQNNLTDFSFLVRRCILEGFRAKVSNNSLIIYNETIFENLNYIEKFDVSDFIGRYEFKKSNLDTYSKCEITYYLDKLIKVENSSSKVLNSNTLKSEIRVKDNAEANRFSVNLLKYKNKLETTAKFCVNLNTNLAGSSNIYINYIGYFSGKYFIESISHDFFNNKSYIYARKVN